MTHDAFTFTYYGLAVTFLAVLFSVALYVLAICIRLDKEHPHWYERYVLYSRFWLVILALASAIAWFVSDTYVWLVMLLGSLVLYLDTMFARRYVRR
jgi:hypothetical protein